MPEEINRVVTDHLSSMLFCPTETSVVNLEREGIREHVYLVGDVMYDALLSNIEIAEQISTILESLKLRARSYFLATVHRAENTEDFTRLRSILKAFAQLAKVSPVIWPVHPRTRKILTCHSFSGLVRKCVLLDPLSYHDMLCLEKGASAILTDSGGVQKEAYWLGVPCVTLRDETEWVETLEGGWNVLAGTDPDRIVASATKHPSPEVGSQDFFGDGHTAEKIVEALLHSYSSRAPRSLTDISLA
jgi:UDP-GlcNAc3NAcA epimerase